jgi:hypothetical protein
MTQGRKSRRRFLVSHGEQSQTDRRAAAGRWATRLAPLLFFVILTAVAARPVVSQLDTVIIGSDIDAFINPWADMWTLRALRDSERSLWRTDYLFYPHGADLYFHSFSHLTSAVSLALRPLLGELPAYNLTILFHVVLSGLAMFHFGRYLTGSAVAGLLAGMVFAFNSHNIWQTAHPVLVSIWPLPWAGMFLLQAIEHQDFRRAFVAAVFVFLAALSSVLMLMLAFLWLGFVLFYALASGRLTRAVLPVVAVFGAASTVLAVIPLLPLLHEALIVGNPSFVIEVSISVPTDILAPLQSYWFGLILPSLHFGVVPLVLIFVALWRFRRAWPWVLFLVVTYLFAIGPQPIVRGTPLDIDLPWSNLVQPLLRHTHRLNVLTSGALAVLVAWGWTAVAERIDRCWWRWPVALVLGGLIFAEYTAPAFPYRSPQVSAFYTEFLDSVPDDVAIAVLPTGRQEDKFYMYYQTLHGHKMTGGVVSRPEPGTFTFIRDNPVLRAGAVNWEPRELPTNISPALQELAAAGVGYLVLDKPLFEENELDLAQWRRAMPVDPVYEDGLVVVFPTQAD